MILVGTGQVLIVRGRGHSQSTRKQPLSPRLPRGGVALLFLGLWKKTPD